jgi:hypothetical protein
MRATWLRTGLLGAALTVAQPAAAGELEERRAILTRAGEAFRTGDFATLESLAQEYRTARSRTPSGIWKLTVLYGAIEDEIPSHKERDERRFEAVEAKIQGWTRAYPRSPAPHIAYSQALIGHGWHFRGAKAARHVPGEAWAPFRRYVEQARENLERHKTVASVDPWWYQTMVRIARAQGWKRARFDALLDEAFRREPLFYQTYFEAFSYLLPKWGGDRGAIEDFANRAVARTQAEEGMGMYARIYWFASQREFDTDLFRSSKAMWPKMRAGFEDVISRYPDAWNLNHYAKFACLAGDRATAGTLLARLPGEPIASAWEPASLLAECRRWTAAR